MNDNELEKLLAGLRPMPASPELEQRVGRELTMSEGLRVIDGEGSRPVVAKARWWQPAAWAALGAAAAFMFMSLNPAITRPSSQGNGLVVGEQAATSAPVPVNSTHQWLDTDDQGVRFNSQKLPERLVRVVSLERHEWVDPRDGAQIAVEIPHEDTLVLPVSFQ